MSDSGFSANLGFPGVLHEIGGRLELREGTRLSHPGDLLALLWQEPGSVNRSCFPLVRFALSLHLASLVSLCKLGVLGRSFAIGAGVPPV